MKIILASKSPRRKQLMDQAGFEYEILVSKFDEKVDEKLSLEDKSKEIAYQKAKDIFENTQGDRVIIGADTMIVLEGKQYGKPKDRKDAIQMLRTLQGKKHSVYTGLAVLIEKDGKYKEYKELHQSNIYLKKMSDEEIENYIDCEMPFDKAGSYGIQTSFIVYIERFEGNYDVIVGLPVGRVYDILKENEIE